MVTVTEKSKMRMGPEQARDVRGAAELWKWCNGGQWLWCKGVVRSGGVMKSSKRAGAWLVGSGGAGKDALGEAGMTVMAVESCDEGALSVVL